MSWPEKGKNTQPSPFFSVQGGNEMGSSSRGGKLALANESIMKTKFIYFISLTTAYYWT